MKKILVTGAATAVLGILLSAVPAQAETSQAGTGRYVVPCGYSTIPGTTFPMPFPVPFLPAPMGPFGGCVPVTPGSPVIMG